MRMAAMLALVAVGVMASVSFVRGVGEELGQGWDGGSTATQAFDRSTPSGAPHPALQAGSGPVGVPGPPLLFGLDAPSIDLAARQGVRPDYGTLWVGAWTLQWGWKVTDAELDRLREGNVTPAVQLYYWGDDIHADCFSVGCHGKTMQGWDELARGLATHLAEHAPGPALVVLETEFNKHQVHVNEDLDGYLAEKATAIRALNPDITVVLGLGNWYPEAWPTWDRAAASADAIGIQAMAGSTHDSDDFTAGLFGTTLAGVQVARELFGKPVIVHDVAVSSYPEPQNLRTQEAALQGLADGLDDLQAAGVEAVLYRAFVDTPNAPVEEHYGEAEKHWGLAWHDTGELKPGGQAWVAAMKGERHAP